MTRLTVDPGDHAAFTPPQVRTDRQACRPATATGADRPLRDAQQPSASLTESTRFKPPPYSARLAIRSWSSLLCACELGLSFRSFALAAGVAFSEPR